MDINKRFFIICLIWLVASYSIIFYCSLQNIIDLTIEDGFYENLTAIFFAFASVMFVYMYIRFREKNDLRITTLNRNIFFLFLGIFFFMGMGEEISWGQRIFHFKPEGLFKNNLQHEVTIHNLAPLNMQELDKNHHLVDKKGIAKLLTVTSMFHMFVVGYTMLLPMFCMNKNVRKLVRRINIPYTSILFGVLFAFNYIFKHLTFYIRPELKDLNYMDEIKECNEALLFFVMSVSILIYTKNKKTKSRNTMHREVESLHSLSGKVIA
jgi:hypothetical protein